MQEGLAADRAEQPYGLLEWTSGPIIHGVRGIDRVTYAGSNKPSATIEGETVR